MIDVDDVDSVDYGFSLLERRVKKPFFKGLNELRANLRGQSLRRAGIKFAGSLGATLIHRMYEPGEYNGAIGELIVEMRHLLEIEDHETVLAHDKANPQAESLAL